MKYVVFEFYGKRVTINRANIVGFRLPDPQLIWTNVILDSGCEVSLNGLYFEDAEKILKDFDNKL